MPLTSELECSWDDCACRTQAEMAQCEHSYSGMPVDVPEPAAHRPGVTACLCGHPSCRDFWLVGVGKFVQGSGFTNAQAVRIAELIEADGDFPWTG